MGPFKVRVPSVPVTRHTNSDLSTLPADATHASSAENRTALTWSLGNAIRKASVVSKLEDKGGAAWWAVLAPPLTGKDADSELE